MSKLAGLQTGVHADVSFVPRKAEVDDSPLHRLGNPLVALLYPLEWYVESGHFGTKVQKRLRLPPQAGASCKLAVDSVVS